jgi:hypothetical protein
MNNVTITEDMGRYFFYISKGKSPKEAVELSVLDHQIELWEKYDISSHPEREERLKVWTRNDDYKLQMRVWSFLHPEVSERVKRMAWTLAFSFLDYEAITAKEREEMEEYLNKMEEYFK